MEPHGQLMLSDGFAGLTSVIRILVSFLAACI